MHILPFVQIRPGDVASVGRKALSLAELQQAKFLVPEGYVVTSDAFSAFLAANQLISAIEAELDKLNILDLHSVEYASRIIRDMIMGGMWPSDLASEVLQQFAHLNAPRAAVRSSVFSENGYSTAWAGELETALNVSLDTLLEHVKKCWASLYSARSLYHLYQRQVKTSDLRMAVIIQRMVPARVSGLTYTAHPVHRDPNQMVIEAGLGLGEAIVSGKIVPDTYIIRKDPFTVLEKNITTQSIVISAAEGEGTETRELPRPVATQKLTTEELSEIAGACLRLEEHYGKPQSVEWVWADDLYFVQSRSLDFS